MPSTYTNLTSKQVLNQRQVNAQKYGKHSPIKQVSFGRVHDYKPVFLSVQVTFEIKLIIIIALLTES